MTAISSPNGVERTQRLRRVRKWCATLIETGGATVLYLPQLRR